MIRGRTEAETCHLNGWTVGTLVAGWEPWGDGKGVNTTWRITAIGESAVLARTIRSEYPHKPADLRQHHESTVTFACREWEEVR